MSAANKDRAHGYIFPFFVPIAALEFRQRALSLPFMCPLTSGGLVFSHTNDATSVRQAIQSVEQVALSIVTSVGPQHIEVREYDFSIAKKFQYLLDLRGTVKYKYKATPSAVEEDFFELVELARYRHREVLSLDRPDIYSFNKDQAVPQPYQLVLVNITDFPFDRISESLLSDFFRTAFEAGIIFLAYGDMRNVKPSVRERAALLLDRMPTVEIGSRVVRVQPAECVTRILSRLPSGAWVLRPLQDLRRDLVNSIMEIYASESQLLGHDFLSVPIGVSLDGRREIRFTLGQKSACYHALIVGNTGTGKTTLINNIVTEIARRYTSKEIVLFLMDYKEGVEFQRFIRHPNVSKIFLDNKDYDAALRLLKDFAELIEERGSIFRERGVRDIDEHNAAFPDSTLPHVILIIDEAQKLFSEDYPRSQEFDELLQDVASRGRSFGVHIILSTQNVLEMDISPRTLEQITLRVAFRLSSERATYKVLGFENLVPLRLGKYEFVYNPMSGIPDANLLGRANPPSDFESVIEQALSERKPEEIIIPQLVRSSSSESKNDIGLSLSTETSTEESVSLLLQELEDIDRLFAETPVSLDDTPNSSEGGDAS